MTRKHRPIEGTALPVCPHCFCNMPPLSAIALRTYSEGTLVCKDCGKEFYYECTVMYKTRRMKDLTETEKRNLKENEL